MSSTCTKHRRRPPSAVGIEDAIAEMPVRRSKQKTEAHSVTLGRHEDGSRFDTLKQIDYGRKVKDVAVEETDKAKQRERVHDMNTKHFVFGHAEVQMVSELRGSLQPPSHEALLSRSARPIGGPNNKGASNLYISGNDKAHWVKTLSSTSRQDYSTHGNTTNTSQEDAKHHIQTMRSSHFAIGSDQPSWASTSRTDYASPPSSCVQASPMKPASTRSFVPLATGKIDTERTSDIYGTGAHDSHPPSRLPKMDLRRSNMVLGYDRRDFKTESMNKFKGSRYIAART